MSRILIIETHMIHQNVRNTGLHISIVFKCDHCKPNVPINMKICHFFGKKIGPDLLSFHAVTCIVMILLYNLYQMIEH